MGVESPEQRKSNFLCCSFRRLNRAIKEHEKQLTALQLAPAEGASRLNAEAETRRGLAGKAADARRGGEVLPGAEAVLGGDRGGGAGTGGHHLGAGLGREENGAGRASVGEEAGVVPALVAEPLALALDRAATRVSLILQVTAVRQLWEGAAQARVEAARREAAERRAQQLREVARAVAAKAQEDLARRAKAGRREQLLQVLRERCQRLSAVPELVPSVSEGARREAAEPFKRSLSSSERSLLAEVRGALRKSFEKEADGFWERSAAESRIRTDKDSAEAYAHLGPRECLRALERAWQLQRGEDGLLAVRLGDSLDIWDPFDGCGCPCDPALDRVRLAQGLGPTPRPCTFCPPNVEDGGARGPLALFGAVVGSLRWRLGRG